MKFVKVIGLSAAALMMLSGLSSASVVKVEGANSKVGSHFIASVTTSALLKTGGGTTIVTCTGGNVGGKLTDAGSSTTTVKASIQEMTWSGCSTTVHTLAKGTGELHYTSGNNATITSSGAEITVQFLGVSCIFKTSSTSIGTFTGGKPATFDVNGTIPQSGGGFLCPSSGIASGAYTLTTPSGTLHAATS